MLMSVGSMTSCMPVMELTDVPPTGEARASALFDYADRVARYETSGLGSVAHQRLQCLVPALADDAAILQRERRLERVDWTLDLADARRAVAGKVALQGNLDPTVMRASPEVIRREARAVLDSYGNHPGHVFNLGHGITPEVDPENMTTLVDEVHAYGRMLRGG